MAAIWRGVLSWGRGGGVRLASATSVVVRAWLCVLFVLGTWLCVRGCAGRGCACGCCLGGVRLGGVVVRARCLGAVSCRLVSWSRSSRVGSCIGNNTK